jgi:hypothetical protein
MAGDVLKPATLKVLWAEVISMGMVDDRYLAANSLWSN